MPQPRPGCILCDEVLAMAKLCLSGANVVGRTPVAVLSGCGISVALYGEGLICDGFVVSLELD
jgi:hypothetical protein